MTIKTIRIKQIFAANPDETAAAVRTMHNCDTVDVDEATGDIWIEGPMRGHWVSGAGLIEIAQFIEREYNKMLYDWAVVKPRRYVIDDVRFGDRSEFVSIEEAEKTIRACGEDFADIKLHEHSGQIWAEMSDMDEPIGTIWEME